MLNRIFILVFFIVTLLGANEAARLESAKKALSSSDEIEQFRGYNEFKTIYLRATLDKNSAVANAALEGIVEGGEKLGIDVSKYQADLAKIKKTAKKVEAPTKIPVVVEASKQSSEVPSVIYDKTFKPALVASKFATPEPEKMIINDPEPRVDEISLSLRHRLLNAQWKDKGLELLFDTPLQPSDVRMSKIIEADKQRYRYIIDLCSAG